MIERHLQLMFAHAYRSLRRSARHDALDPLFQELDRLRRSVPDPLWRSDVRHFADNHPIRDVLLDDPFTRLGHLRGSSPSTEAALLDLVLRGGCPDGASEIGRRVFRCTSRRLGWSVFRERRRSLGAVLRRVVRRRKEARVTIIGCGRLREAEQFDTELWTGIEQLVAVDDDDEHLDFIEHSRRRWPVSTLWCDVQRLLSGSLDLPPQDLIHASTWIDHLDPQSAGCFARRLIDLLKPGGCLMLSSIARHAPGQAYAELFMNCHRQQRDRARFVDELVRPIEGRLAKYHVAHDDHRSTIRLVGRTWAESRVKNME